MKLLTLLAVSIFILSGDQNVRAAIASESTAAIDPSTTEGSLNGQTVSRATGGREGRNGDIRTENPSVTGAPVQDVNMTRSSAATPSPARDHK